MSRFSGMIQSGKTGVVRLYQNPNTRFAMIGLIGASVIVAATLIALQIFGREDSIEDFVQAWEEAIESKQPELYQRLWDTAARNENWEMYERALKLFSKEKIDADVAGLTPRPDLRNENRKRIERIPVTIYQEGEVLVTLYRDLTVEQRGILRRWKLVSDEIRDEMAYPETTEEVIVQESAPTPRSENLDSPFQQISSGPGLTVTRPDVTSPIAGDAPLDAKLKLSQVLGTWQQAWQQKDLQTYMAQYAEEAEIIRVSIKGGKEHPIRLNKAQLREKMVALNKRYNKITVSISNLQINGDNAVADVGFLQEFIGSPASGNRPAYSDFGTKKLIFMIDPDEGLWKIYSESWKLYKDVPKYPKL